jgi:hypothetical protein
VKERTVNLFNYGKKHAINSRKNLFLVPVSHPSPAAPFPINRTLTMHRLEVGQALLHRHEAYVRSQQAVLANAERNAQLYSDAREKVATVTVANNQLVAKMSHLVKENNHMEKRLMQTMLNLEVESGANRTLLHEVQEARGTISRLSTQSMKSVGWESRVQSLQQECDDLGEERKAESARARSAEAKVAALTDKCSTLGRPYFRSL